MAPLAEPAAELVVWIANPVGATDQPYVKAVMIATDDESAAASDLGARCVVRPVGGGPEVQLRTSEVHPCNPSGHRPDNTQLLYLNEPCVIENIAHRYEELEIYTWTSRILVAVNPYETVDLYTDALAATLPALTLRELPPHAFSIAELAYRGLQRNRESQAVVVSGESGSGKTVSMAHVISYLTRRTGGGASGGLGGNSGEGGVGGTPLSIGLSELVLQSNPMLEAFGNAATARNHNSSRFGKFVRLLFDAGGYRMSGLRMQTYLLEKVRVSRPPPAELTYHVFYYLLAGASPTHRKVWGLGAASEHAQRAYGNAGRPDRKAAHAEALRVRVQQAVRSDAHGGRAARVAGGPLRATLGHPPPVRRALRARARCQRRREPGG